ncbi:Rho GTPase activation protein [Chytridium lagenaria]|nr:Rho GTPase activation protein [Chytridium lagenaria]
MAAAVIVQERSVVWKGKAAEMSADVGIKAKEAYAAARKSEIYEKGRRTLVERKSTDSLSYPGIFGMPLQEVLARTKQDSLDATVPPIVFRCVEYINSAFLTEIGLYRVSGSSTEINYLKGLFNIGGDVDLFELQPDCNAVCSVFKGFLRELPDPILTNKLAADFQALFPGGEDSGSLPSSPTSPSPEMVITPLLVSSILNVDVLRLLMSHLDKVQQHSSENKMTLTNLAVIFSPTLQINSSLFKALILNWDILLPADSGISEVYEISQLRPLRRSTGDKELYVDSNPFETDNHQIPPRTGARKPVSAARSIDSMMESATLRDDMPKAYADPPARVSSPPITRSNVNSIAGQFEGLRSVNNSPLAKPASNGSIRVPLKGGDNSNSSPISIQTSTTSSSSNSFFTTTSALRPPPSASSSSSSSSPRPYFQSPSSSPSSTSAASTAPRKIPPPPPPSRKE